jgi:signal peptidase I
MNNNLKYEIIFKHLINKNNYSVKYKDNYIIINSDNKTIKCNAIHFLTIKQKEEIILLKSDENNFNDKILIQQSKLINDFLNIKKVLNLDELNKKINTLINKSFNFSLNNIDYDFTCYYIFFDNNNYYAINNIIYY